MKISLITVTYNAEEFLESCINSVICQTYSELEYIIIDGKSLDCTLNIINKFQNKIDKVVTEADLGIYDAMNKGIRLATGDVIGILNADDFFTDENVIRVIAETFKNYNTDIVYGDLSYVDRHNTDKIVRKWVSKEYRRDALNWGWMPAHPTFYARREMFEKFGYYDLNYGTAADYELMLRFMYKFKCSATYIKKVLVKMRVGGVSNITLKSRIKASLNDLKAMKANGVELPYIAVGLKPLRKIAQFV
jgi:glycosyltransferase